MKNKELRGFLTAVFAMLFWSLSFVWVKVVFESYKPFTVIFFRLIISVALLTVFLAVTKRLKMPDKKTMKSLLLVAIFEPFLYFLGETNGLQYVSSTLGSVIISTIPLFTPIAGWFLLKERISSKNVVGLVLSFVGVTLVAVNPNFSLAASPKGLMLLMLAVFSAVGYSVVLKDLADKLSPLNIIFYQNLIGIFLFAPIWYFSDFDHVMQVGFQADAMIAIFKLAVFASTIAFVLYTYSIRDIGITKAAVFCNTIPVFTAIFAYFIIDEVITLQKTIGIAIVIGGLLLTQQQSHKKGWKLFNITSRRS
ncbi:DMT family transporter [Prolixibacteraceae bacterium JC049]|nr:DMT family transporter [Prolixibacteraceae bacterium JC049]